MGRRRWGAPAVPFVLAAAYASGALPVSNIAARLTRGVDLRTVGPGTVSGTSLYRVSGFPTLAVAGVVDVAKGAVGPVLAGRSRPCLQAAAAAAAIVGHNWSVFLCGAGGRGIAPSLGVLLATEPVGVPLLLGGLLAGRSLRQSGVGTLVGLAALARVLDVRRGNAGRLLAGCLAGPMIAKRVAGNGPPPAGAGPAVYVWRLLLDRDEP